MAEGIKHIGASRASIISTIGPVITITIAILLLDEVFGMTQAIGGLMIILGVFFIVKKKQSVTTKI